MIAKIVRFFGDEEHAKRRRRLLYAILLVVVAADFLVPREHGDFFWDLVPGWGAFYGFISCGLIVYVSKFLGHQGGLMVDEDHYD